MLLLYSDVDNDIEEEVVEERLLGFLLFGERFVEDGGDVDFNLFFGEATKGKDSGVDGGRKNSGVGGGTKSGVGGTKSGVG